MDWAVIRTLTLAAMVVGAPMAAFAHQLIVFASVDCTEVTVEAKFTSGNVAQVGDVRVLDDQNQILMELTLDQDGTARVPLDQVDHSRGLVVEVDTGSHDNYWIVTPEDIARKCGS